MAETPPSLADIAAGLSRDQIAALRDPALADPPIVRSLLGGVPNWRAPLLKIGGSVDDDGRKREILIRSLVGNSVLSHLNRSETLPTG